MTCVQNVEAAVCDHNSFACCAQRIRYLRELLTIYDSLVCHFNLILLGFIIAKAGESRRELR
jgi:hypothetical protein